MAELSQSDKGDDVESIRFSDLLSGHYFRGTYNWDRPIPAFSSLYYAAIFMIIIRAYPMLEVLHCKCFSFSFFATVVFIGSTIFALQQLSGINAVFYFSSAIFNSAGVPSNLANLCVGFANLSGDYFALCYV